MAVCCDTNGGDVLSVTVKTSRDLWQLASVGRSTNGTRSAICTHRKVLLRPHLREGRQEPG